MATNPTPLGIYRAAAEQLKIKMLLYGNPGAGKTTLALTMNDHPAMSPALVLNFEGGLLSVVGRGDVDVIDIHTIDDLENVFWYLETKHESVRRFKSLVVDSGSELYQKSLREVVAQNMDRRRNRKGDEDDYELEDYGKTSNIVFRLFSMFRDLPLHVVVTSHAKFVYPQGGDSLNADPKEVRPSFSISLSNRLEGSFDFVHYLYAYDEEVISSEGEAEVKSTVTHRGLLTRQMGAYHAKTRGPNFAAALGDNVIDPTMPMLYDLLLATESEAARIHRDSGQVIPDTVEHPETDEDEMSANGTAPFQATNNTIQDTVAHEMTMETSPRVQSIEDAWANAPTTQPESAESEVEEITV